MKKLSENDLHERDSLISLVDEAAQHLRDEVEKFNREVRTLYRHGPEEAKDELNEALSNLRSWAEDLHSATEEHFQGESEEWQESKEGKAYSDWSSTFDDAASMIEDTDLDDVEEIDFNQVDYDAINDLNEEPDDVSQNRE